MFYLSFSESRRVCRISFCTLYVIYLNRNTRNGWKNIWMRLQSYVSSIVWHKQFDSKPCANHLLLPHHATRTGSQKGAPCTYIWCIMHLESLLASAQQNAFKTNDNAKQHIISLIMRTSFSVDVNGRSNERVANCHLQVRLFVRSIAKRSHLIFSWLSMYPNWI